MTNEIPPDARPYVYETLRSLVSIYTEVRNIAKLLVRPLLEHVFEKICLELAEVAKLRAKYNVVDLMTDYTRDRVHRANDELL